MSWLGDIVGNIAGDAVYYFGGGQEAETQGKALDQQIDAMQKQELATGKWSQAEYDQAQSNLQAGQTGDVQAQLDQAGQEGANQSAVGKAIDSTSGFSFSLLGNILGAIPWWAWIGAGAAVFLYFGGGSIVRHKLIRRFS